MRWRALDGIKQTGKPLLFVLLASNVSHTGSRGKARGGTGCVVGSEEEALCVTLETTGGAPYLRLLKSGVA